MCRVYLCLQYDPYLWLLGQIYSFCIMASCPTLNFCLLWHWHIISGTWVYLSRIFMISIRRWPLTSWSNLEGLDIFVHSHSQTIFGTWVCHHRMICHIQSWPSYDLYLWPQYQNDIFRIVFAPWHMHTKFGTWQVSIQIYAVSGVSLVSFTHSLSCFKISI